MSYKRIVCFLLLLGVILGWGILSPGLERSGKEYESVTTSISVTPFGFKALYLLADRVHKKERKKGIGFWQHSMMNARPETPRTLWFNEPTEDLFFDGDAYGQHMKDLVEKGYHLIFVLDGYKEVHADEWYKPKKEEDDPYAEEDEKDEETSPPPAVREQKRVTSDDESSDKTGEKKLYSPLDFLNHWYGLSLGIERWEPKEPANIRVKSHFQGRQIDHLSYQSPKAKDSSSYNQEYNHQKWQGDTPFFYTFLPDTIKNAQILLETEEGKPLIVRYPMGKGSITLFPDSLLLKNAQLNKGDNAALAMALLEENPNPEMLFEVYSAGFNENGDFLSYLASGKGLTFLITMVMMFVLFCVWLINLPVRRIFQLKNSDERYFTQEIFIAALAKHYLGTGDWHGLYQKMLTQFQRDLDQRYPGTTLEQQIQRIASSPFLDVSLETLHAVFSNTVITNENQFLSKCQALLDVQRKVRRHEQPKPNAGGTRSPASTPPAQPDQISSTPVNR